MSVLNPPEFTKENIFAEVQAELSVESFLLLTRGFLCVDPKCKTDLKMVEDYLTVQRMFASSTVSMVLWNNP